MAMAPNQDTRVGGEGPDVGRPGSRARLNILGRVDDALYARALTPFVAEVERLRPDGAEVIDAHTHLGLDEDGRSLTPPQLLSMLDDAGARRACVFPLHDPERRPAYRVPNDRVLEWARDSGERLLPFCRLDPAEGPLAESERCLQAGARGIKLHPRAQDFVFDGREMDDVFGLAESAHVPILIHAGRGLPPLADGLVALAMRHPQTVLILAHGAICDQGTLTSRLADHGRVLYDITCFFPLDVIELFARVPAERIVFASDPPYGRAAPTRYLALRVARQTGLAEAATRGRLGGTLSMMLAAGELPARASARRQPHRGPPLAVAALALAQPEPAGEGRARLSYLVGEQPAREQVGGRARHRAGKLQQQRAQQVRDDHRAARVGARGIPRR